MNEINETVTISVERYDDLIESDTLLYERNEEIKKLKDELGELKELILEMCFREHTLENYRIEQLTDITSYTFGFANVNFLLNCFTYNELIRYIKMRKGAYEGRNLKDE